MDITQLWLILLSSPFQATSCTALEMPTSSEILQVILEYIYTDESPTIKGNFSSVSLKHLAVSMMFYCLYVLVLLN